MDSAQLSLGLSPVVTVFGGIVAGATLLSTVGVSTGIDVGSVIVRAGSRRRRRRGESVFRSAVAS